MNNRLLIFAATFILPLIIIIFLPFGLNITQGVLLGAVLITVSWWTTNAINKNIASTFLITVFLLVSKAPMSIIFKFPVSSNFFVLTSTFLITEGIVKSNLANRISKYMIVKYGYTSGRLVILSFILGFLLIFIIPQPFPRVILLSAVYMEFLKAQNVRKETLSAILFSIYVASTATSMFFTTGDILLNNVALQIGNVKLSWIGWAVYMAVPSLVISTLMYILFISVFRKELSGAKFSISDRYDKSKFSMDEKKAIVIVFIVLLLWMTESLHGINPALVGCAGAAAMFVAGLLKFKDIKKININLLIFLTAAFSIGGVLNHSGAAKVLYSQMLRYLPDSGSVFYIMFIISVVMVLHLVLGSSVTTISVVLPGLLSVTGGTLNPVVITLIAYTVVNIHYLLPFHHATIMIGGGEDYYPSTYVIKYGIILTVFIFIAVPFIELPWWRILNLL